MSVQTIQEKLKITYNHGTEGVYSIQKSSQN